MSFGAVGSCAAAGVSVGPAPLSSGVASGARLSPTNLLVWHIAMPFFDRPDQARLQMTCTDLKVTVHQNNLTRVVMLKKYIQMHVDALTTDPEHPEVRVRTDSRSVRGLSNLLAEPLPKSLREQEAFLGHLTDEFCRFQREATSEEAAIVAKLNKKEISPAEVEVMMTQVRLVGERVVARRIPEPMASTLKNENALMAVRCLAGYRCFSEVLSIIKHECSPDARIKAYLTAARCFYEVRDPEHAHDFISRATNCAKSADIRSGHFDSFSWATIVATLIECGDIEKATAITMENIARPQPELLCYPFINYYLAKGHDEAAARSWIARIPAGESRKNAVFSLLTSHPERAELLREYLGADSREQVRSLLNRMQALLLINRIEEALILGNIVSSFGHRLH